MEKTKTGIKTLNVAIKKLNEKAETPKYKIFSDSGCDLVCCADVTIPVGQIKLVGTGISIKIPHGYEAQIRPRSGLAAKHGVSVINSPGTIDSDYTGEVKVALIILGSAPLTIKKGEAFAQMVFCPVYKAVFHEVADLDLTCRGDGGFGHTDKFGDK